MNNWIRLHFECVGISFFGNQLGTELREMPDCVCAPSTPQTTTAATSIRNLFVFYIHFIPLSFVCSFPLVISPPTNWIVIRLGIVLLSGLLFFFLFDRHHCHIATAKPPQSPPQPPIYQSAAAAAACSSSSIKRWLVHCGPFARHVLQPR